MADGPFLREWCRVTDRAARNLLIGLTIAVAATRFAALSHSMWDWDEALFAAALRHYNVAHHNPHPPGFPLFIAMAKVIRTFVPDDFLALRTLNLIVSSLLFPAFFAMGRAFGFSFRTAVCGALMYAFLPNVVFWGGTAMSDVAAAVVFAASAALLLRGVETRGFLAGSAVFAASMLIRPQNVVAAYPWFLAAVRQVKQRGRRGVGVALAGGAVVIAVTAAGYGAAAWKTGWGDYADAVRLHGEYVRSVDGYHNPTRAPALSKGMLWSFIVNPVNARALPLIACFAGVALLIPRARHYHVLATYAPQMIFALFMLNPQWVSRFSVAYLAAHCLLAAGALEVLTDLLARAARLPARAGAAIQGSLAAAAAIGSAIWVWPALREVRSHDSPPVRAAQWIASNLRPEKNVLYVHVSMGPFIDYYLGQFRRIEVGDDFETSSMSIRADSYFTADHPAFGENAVVMRRPHLRNLTGLYNRYYEACVAPIDVRVTYGPGWYGEESDGTNVWRWMGRAAHIALETSGRPARLTLRMYAPVDAVQNQTLTVSANGNVIDRYPITSADIERHYDLTLPGGTRSDILIEVDKTVVPKNVAKGGDDRELGLKLLDVTWTPVR
jgi:hypothetical protein